MRKYIALSLALLASTSLAGDEWQSPLLAPRSSYDSAEPPYHLIGVERSEQNCNAWVVADELQVHRQSSVNRIVSSVHEQVTRQDPSGCVLRIHFYRTVHAKPRDPSFRITEQLGTYDGHENKITFVGDSEHYGGWVFGPDSLRAMQPNT